MQLKIENSSCLQAIRTRLGKALITNLLCRYGQYQWGSLACKTFRPAIPGGAPASWVTNTACVLDWSKPVLHANIGFLVLVPAVAALAAIALVGLRQHNTAAGSARNSFSTKVQGWLSMQLPPT